MVEEPNLLAYTVRQITERDDLDLTSIEAIFSVAFEKDLFTAVVTNRDREFYGKFWASFILAGFLGGEAYVAEDINKNVVGAAAWYEPGRALFDSKEQVDEALEILHRRFSPELSKWWEEELLPKYDQFTIAVLGEGTKLAAWHLQAIGVDPKFQKQGIAKTFVDKIKAKAAKEGASLCLEAETETNVTIYEHLGFQVKGHQIFKGDAGEFPMWVMLQVVPKK